MSGSKSEYHKKCTSCENQLQKKKAQKKPSKKSLPLPPPLTSKCEKSLQPQRQSVLDVLNPDRDCGCEVVARAIRSNIHMNLGLTELREAVDRRNSHTSSDDEPAK